MYSIRYSTPRLIHVLTTCALALILATLGFGLTTALVDAHERRAVGQYAFVVGFTSEPAFVEDKNGVSLRITRAANNEPVEGAEKTLKVEVSFANQKRTFDLRAAFGQPGSYSADLIPTRAGTYTFRFFGSLDGLAVDETFVSGPGRFNDVQSREEIQFPERLPALASVSKTANDAQVAAESASAAASSSRDSAASARTLAVIGVVVGALGLTAGAGSLLLARRR